MCHKVREKKLHFQTFGEVFLLFNLLFHFENNEVLTLYCSTYSVSFGLYVGFTRLDGMGMLHSVFKIILAQVERDGFHFGNTLHTFQADIYYFVLAEGVGHLYEDFALVLVPHG